MGPYLRSFGAVIALSNLASLSSMVSAQQSALLFIPNADPQPLVGSVLGTNKATTTYEIQCTPGTDSSDCGFQGPITYTKEGTSSMQYEMGVEGVTAIVGCSLGGTTTAMCSASASGAAATDDPAAASLLDLVITTTYGPEEIRFTQIPITGGKAQATGAAATTTSTGGTDETPSSTMAPSTASSKAGSSTSASTTASSGPQIGQAQPTQPGSTGGVTSLESRSIIALVGAAAMAAVMI